MKASLKFRDHETNQPPLFKAKVPINILSFPFQSSLWASSTSPKDPTLSLNLSTSFESGPSFKFEYRPNNPKSPFGLIIKTGIGSFGSPKSSTFSITTEFNFNPGPSPGEISGPGPSFNLTFKPRFGDFDLVKSMESTGVDYFLTGRTKLTTTVGNGEENSLADLEEFIDGGETTNITRRGLKNINEHNGILNSTVNGGVTNIGGILMNIDVFNGVGLTAKTVLPIQDKALVGFKWGVRLPKELKRRCFGGGKEPVKDVIAWDKMPFLLMSKMSIEQVEAKKDAKVLLEKMLGGGEVEESVMSGRRQLEDLVAESKLLRKAVEEIRAEIDVGGSSMDACVGKGTYNGSSDQRKGLKSGVKVEDVPKKVKSSGTGMK